MRTRLVRAAALALLPCALSACVLLDVLMIPVRLIFGGLEALGNGIGSLVSMDCRVEPLDGLPPQVTPLDGGRWLVEAPSEPARFRVTLSAPGHEARSYVWPDDFAGAPVDRDGTAHVECLLAALPADGR